MNPKLTEINIVPIKPTNGLVAFASFILDGNLYLSSIGIYTRSEGGYRLTYPTRKTESNNLNIYYPINKNFGQYIEKVIIKKFEEVMNKSNDRHNHSENDTR